MVKPEGLGAEDVMNLGLLDNHTYLICGEINEEVIQGAIRWLIYENASDEEKELTLYINSTGGNLTDAFALIDLMKHSKHYIRTIGLGSVMSSAFLIFASGSIGHRYIAKNASILSHQYSDELGDVKHHDIKSFAKEAEYTNQRMVNLLKECSGLSSAEVKRKLLPPTDVWLTAEEALDLNVADHILQEGEFSKMLTGGKKFVKPVKTKFRKNKDQQGSKQEKQKHHDKSFYRLVKQEKEDYVVQRQFKKTHFRT